MHLSRVTRQPQRFFDAGTPQDPAEPGAPVRIVLEWHVDDGGRSFSMGRAIGYDDRRLGRLIVPADPGFRTDLTSVPWLFTWLVPRTGTHLPAALLHDGLVGGAGEGPSYVSEQGHDVARDQADRVFRDAMADTGTRLVRRWLVWTAVAVATIFVGSASWSRLQWWHYRVAAALTLVLVVVLGSLGTADLFDVGPGLPWMGDRPWWLEVLGGLAGAVAVPLLLSLAWGRFRVAGAIGGVAVAVLLHVSVALLLLTVLYQGVELLVRRAPGLAAVVGGGVAVLSVAVALALGLG